MTVHYEVDRSIATITLDTPENRNALSSALVGQLTATMSTVPGVDSVRVLAEGRPYQECVRCRKVKGKASPSDGPGSGDHAGGTAGFL